MGAYNGRYDQVIDQFQQMDPRLKRQLQEWIQQYLDEEGMGSPNMYAGNTMSTYGTYPGDPSNYPETVQHQQLPDQAPPPPPPPMIGSGSGDPIEQGYDVGPGDPNYERYLERERKEAEAKAAAAAAAAPKNNGGGGGSGQPPIADQGSGGNFPAAPPPPAPNSFEQNIKNVGAKDDPEGRAAQDKEWQGIMARTGAEGTGKWNDRAKGWRSYGDAAYGAGVIDPLNDYGDDSWMNTMATNDDITLSTTPGWGQANMGDMPESWKGEMAGWSEDLRKMAEEYYASGKEEEFQRTRNVARAQNNRKTPGQNQGGQPNNGVVAPPVRDTSKEAPEGPNVVSNVKSIQELDDWNKANVPGYEGSKEQQDLLRNVQGGGGQSNQATGDIPGQYDDVDTNGQGLIGQNLVIPPVNTPATQVTGASSLNTDELKDIFKNKKKVPWNDRSAGILGSLPKVY